MKLISKIDQIAAWILLASFIIYMLSGIDTVRRILIPQISSLVHLKYLFIPAQIAFTIHTSYAIHLAIKRWKIWNSATKTIIGVYIILNLALITFYISNF